MKVARVNGRTVAVLDSFSGLGGTTPVPGVGDLSDVDLGGIADGDTIIWDDATDTWIVGPAASSSDFLTVIDGAGDVISTVAAAGSTETIDLADGNVHDITLTDDCTFTFTAVDSSRARSFTMFLRQDGTGGWLATWPGSVVWAGGSAPTLSTDPDAVDVLTFVTLDGGVVWFGFPTGGGGSSLTPASTVEDETTWSITPAVGTDLEYARQDHTHGTPDDTELQAAGHYEILMAGGITSPPEPLENGDGSDWLYVWVPG